MLKRLAAPEYGIFVPPTVLRVEGIEALAEEVFGPVLHVATFGADEIDDVVDAINGSGYGLTFGLHTRIDDRVQHIVDRVRVGNIYVNRNQIGAVVGSQPFGGEGLSGTGPKAGGPHYVRRLMARAAPAGGAPAGAVVDEALLGAAIADAVRGLAARPRRRGTGTHTGGRGGVSFSPLELPGPTGESNRLSFAPRGAVLCLGPGAEAVQAQVATARAAGKRRRGGRRRSERGAHRPRRRSPRGHSGRAGRAVHARHGGRYRRRRLLCGPGCSQGDACRACPTLRPDPAVDCGARRARALCAGAPPLRRYHGGGRQRVTARAGGELDLNASWTKADGHVRLCFFVRRRLLRDSGALAYIRATPLFLMPNWWIRDSEEALERAASDTLNSFPSVEIADARIDAVLAFDRTEQLGEIRTPTLVLCARDDILTPPYYSEELARLIPGAELVILQKGGHACSQTTPAQFNEVVLPFLLQQTQ